jgi:hypothetical protein
MSCQKQLESARANGAKSKGPITEAGKQRSSQNSRRHSLLSRTVLLDGEDPQRFAELIAALEHTLSPQNEVEREIVESMAVARWRILRIYAIEGSTLRAEVQKHDPQQHDAADRSAIAFRSLSDQSHCLDLLHRYERGFERHYQRSLALLLKLGAQAPGGRRAGFARPDHANETNRIPFSANERAPQAQAAAPKPVPTLTLVPKPGTRGPKPGRPAQASPPSEPRPQSTRPPLPSNPPG